MEVVEGPVAKVTVVLASEETEEQSQAKILETVVDLLFKLYGPNGHVWKIYLDGTTKGFPPGTMVVNHARPLIMSLAAKLAQAEQAKQPPLR